MNDYQQRTLRRMITALDRRYQQVNGDLCDGIDALEKVLARMSADQPLGDEIEAILKQLIKAAGDSSELRIAVADLLSRQVAQMRSAKKAYEQGWDAHLFELLSQATPEQAAVLRALLLDMENDDDLPF